MNWVVWLNFRSGLFFVLVNWLLNWFSSIQIVPLNVSMPMILLTVENMLKSNPLISKSNFLTLLLVSSLFFYYCNGVNYDWLWNSTYCSPYHVKWASVSTELLHFEMYRSLSVSLTAVGKLMVLRNDFFMLQLQKHIAN